MEHLLTSWGYVALLVATFISAMGIPIGAEIAIGYGGALASGQVLASGHHFNFVLVIVVATIGEVLGSSAGYTIGYFGGRPLLDRVGRYLLVTKKDLDRTEAWFKKRGEIIVLLGRFVPLLRSFVSLGAGLAEMTFAKFLAFTILGCAIWCTVLASIGYGLGGSWHHVIKDFSYAGYFIAAVAVLVIALGIWHRLRALRVEKQLG